MLVRGVHSTAGSSADSPAVRPLQRSSYLAVVMETEQLWPNWSGDEGDRKKVDWGWAKLLFSLRRLAADHLAWT